MRKALLAMTALWPVAAVAQTAQTSCAVPVPAAAAGYNMQTLGPNVTLGRNWIKDTQNGTTANATQNSDGSVTVAGGGDTWNGQLETYVGGRGAAFGGGFYAQATISVPGATSCLASFDNCGNNTGPGNQWPSFWANSTGNTIETDFMEMENPTPGQYQATVINWTTKPQTGYGQTITAPAGNTLNGPNTYGFLWIPATATSNGSMSFFLNGQQVGNPITWSKANPGLYGIIDGQKMVLRLGAGPNSPATFSNVQVWQANASQDIGVTTSLLCRARGQGWPRRPHQLTAADTRRAALAELWRL